MEEKHYMISDAAKLVDVESHVLRYWEEELKIDIPRNEMGHRYYTDTYIRLFREIKSLKEQGFLLKAIKTLLPELMEGKTFSGADSQTISIAMAGEGREPDTVDMQGEVQAAPIVEAAQTVEASQAAQAITASQTLQTAPATQINAVTPTVAKLAEQEKNVCGEEKIEQFRIILGGIVSQAIEDNNEVLGKEVSSRVSDSVIKEMDYLLRLKEEREEERYKKFDEILRNYQRGNKEAAATAEKRGLFGGLRRKK